MRADIDSLDLSKEIPPELLSSNASNDMMLFTSCLSLFIAVAMIYMGIKGKQYWMVFWASGLIIMSVVAAWGVLFGFEMFV